MSDDTVQQVLRRLEAATEPSRDIDLDVLWAVFPDARKRAFNGVRYISTMTAANGEFWYSPLKDRTDCLHYTGSFSDAYSLLPASVTNFYLFSFGGHGRDDVKGDCWGCQIHDRVQLIGAERAQRNIKRLNRSFKVDIPPSVRYERAIAEQFCEFSMTHVATPAMAICGVALKVRIGQTTDDDLWPDL